jgi:aspartyl-tRNA(Asn)/glutamyl-tRNA(Gln) amidotransferase subunit B
VKNVNSFRFLQRAIAYEIERQSTAVARGEAILQETRLFDADTGRTESMRSKEEAHDYRYFPEPDLPLLLVTESDVARVRERLPELPHVRRERFVTQYGLPAYDAGVLTQARDVADYFEQVAAKVSPKAASTWVMGEVLRRVKDEEDGLASVPVPPDALAALIATVEAGAISGSVAKDVFEKMWATGDAASAIITREGLVQIDDEASLRASIDEVIAATVDAGAKYREGKTPSFGFLVGQVMKATGGKANPKVVNGLLRRVLEG